MFIICHIEANIYALGNYVNTDSDNGLLPERECWHIVNWTFGKKLIFVKIQ